MSQIQLHIDYRLIGCIYGSERPNYACEAGRPNGRFRAQEHRIELKLRGKLLKSTSLYHWRKAAMSYSRLYFDFRCFWCIFGSERSNYACEAGGQKGWVRAQEHQIKHKIRGNFCILKWLYNLNSVSITHKGLYIVYRLIRCIYGSERPNYKYVWSLLSNWTISSSRTPNRAQDSRETA